MFAAAWIESDADCPEATAVPTDKTTATAPSTIEIDIPARRSGLLWASIREGRMSVDATQLAMLFEGLSEWFRSLQSA
jgi:hypothetical protein